LHDPQKQRLYWPKVVNFYSASAFNAHFRGHPDVPIS